MEVFNVKKLLTPAFANTKTAKNDVTSYLSTILHLAPSDVAGIPGFNVCPSASPGCKAACLNTAGRGRFDNVKQARINKTKLYYSNRDHFYTLLVKELWALQVKAGKLGVKAVARLNGTSDIAWEQDNVLNTGMNIFTMFPGIIFYDYTKRPERAVKFINNALPSNYYLTFSCSEVNWVVSKRLLAMGIQVAVVFNNIPTSYEGFTVINGDNTDLRFNDYINHGKTGLIIGLKAKGKAKKDLSGFVKQVTIQTNNIAA